MTTFSTFWDNNKTCSKSELQQSIADKYASAMNGVGPSSHVEAYKRHFKLLTEYEELTHVLAPKNIFPSLYSMLYQDMIEIDKSGCFAKLSIAEKLIYWNLIGIPAISFIPLSYWYREGIEPVVALFAFGNLSFNLKTLLFQHFVDVWPLATWFYENHSQAEIDAQGMDQKAVLELVKLARTENVTWEAIIGLYRKTVPRLGYSMADDMLPDMRPSTLTPEFVNKMLHDNPPMTGVRMTTVIACFRVAYNLDESVPDEWVEKAFF